MLTFPKSCSFEGYFPINLQGVFFNFSIKSNFRCRAVKTTSLYIRWSSWAWWRSSTRPSPSLTECARRQTMPSICSTTRWPDDQHCDRMITDQHLIYDETIRIMTIYGKLDEWQYKWIDHQVAAVKESLERKQRRLSALLARYFFLGLGSLPGLKKLWS